jgi:hypothetical protein
VICGCFGLPGKNNVPITIALLVACVLLAIEIAELTLHKMALKARIDLCSTTPAPIEQYPGAPFVASFGLGQISSKKLLS